METIEKDILTVESGIICHQVNCEGVMGAGLALQIKKKWPDVYSLYRVYCGELRNAVLGKCQIINPTEGLFVVNLFGQQSYGNANSCYTNYAALQSALSTMNAYAVEHSLQIYIPYKLACGLAGGNWNKVEGILKYECPSAIICRLPK